MSKSERRRHPREAIEAKVYLWWQDSRSADCIAHGHCVDVSIRGLQVEISHPIAARTVVYFRFQELHVTASATVRYCRQRGRTYRVGLEMLGQENILQRIVKAGAGAARALVP